MSKRENHWYIIGASTHALGRLPRVSQVRATWPLLLALLVVLVLMVTVQLSQDQTAPAVPPEVFPFLIAALALAATLAFARWKARSVRTNYMRALQHAGPERLIEELERSMQAASALPDVDAFTAQSKAIGYALYGRDEDATRTLAKVTWVDKAPLIQGIGLSAQGVVELLCRRDVRRALELHRKAQALASVSHLVPGAAQSDNYHATCVAVAEVLLQAASPASLERLERSAGDVRFPPLQLLATFGLAAAHELSGDANRAAELRARLRAMAPHCLPLHLPAHDFTTSAPGHHAVAGRNEDPVSTSLSTANGPDAPIRKPVQRQALRGLGLLIGLWAALILMFLLIWFGVAPAQ